MAAYVIIAADTFTSGPTTTWYPSTWTGSALALVPEVFPLTEELLEGAESLGDKRARSHQALAEAVSRGRKREREPRQERHGFAQACRLPCYRGVRRR